MLVESKNAVDDAVAVSAGAAPPRCNGGVLPDGLDAVDSRILAEFGRRADLWTRALGGSSAANEDGSRPIPISRQTVRELFAVIDTLTRREVARRRQAPTLHGR
jgi:hypothetical protein